MAAERTLPATDRYERPARELAEWLRQDQRTSSLRFEVQPDGRVTLTCSLAEFEALRHRLAGGMP
jgi:hypothetical protein